MAGMDGWWGWMDGGKTVGGKQTLGPQRLTANAGAGVCHIVHVRPGNKGQHGSMVCGTVLLSLNMGLWVRLSVVHFLLINKSNEHGSESTRIGSESEWSKYPSGSEQNGSEWVGIWSEYGRNPSENGWLPCQS